MHIKNRTCRQQRLSLGSSTKARKVINPHILVWKQITKKQH